MAAGTNFGGKQAESGIGRPLYVMGVMAVYTRGNVWVSSPNKVRSMDAVFVEVINLGMAALASLGDAATRLIRVGDIMSAVAIAAYRGLLIAALDG